MPDLSAAMPMTAPEEAFLRVVDPEGKLTAVLEDLGPVAGRDVLVIDAGRGHRARQLAEIGARVTAVTFIDRRDEDGSIERLDRLPGGEADVVVCLWSDLAVPGSGFLDAVERLLRPGGRLLVVHDYGRDDVWNLRPASEHDRMVEWSRRGGPFLSAGYKIRVVHCWWAFGSVEEARWLLGSAFGETGAALVGSMKRLRLEYQIAVYHRSVAAADFGAEPTTEDAGFASTL
jgi:hypothetical protein